MVSPFMGMGGRDGLCGPPGPCADTVLMLDCSTNKRTNAIAGNNDLRFLFIVDFFL